MFKPFSFGMDKICWTLLLGISFVLVLIPAWAANSCGATYCTYDSNIMASETWIDGNTYVLTGDVNVTGSGVVLTIQPGAVVKYDVNTELKVFNSARIAAEGTVDKNILFLSCRDQNTYAGATNANTSAAGSCSGAPGFRDYNVAIAVHANSGMTTSDNFSYLKILNATIGIDLYEDINSIHDSNFMHYQNGVGAANVSRAVLLRSSSAVTIQRNFFGDFLNAASGILTVAGTFSGVIRDNNFFYSSGTTASGISTVGFSGQIFSNAFSNAGNGIILSGTTTGQIFDNNFLDVNTSGLDIESNFSGKIFGNIFDGQQSSSSVFIFNANSAAISGEIFSNRFQNARGYGIQIGQGTIATRIHNNLFRNFNGAAAIDGEINLIDATIQNNTFSNFNGQSGLVFADVGGYGYTGAIQRNVFVDVNRVFQSGSSITGTVSHNAYFNVITPNGDPNDHASDENSATGFTSNPFIADGTDRNFLLNATAAGGAQLAGAGGVDVNSFFQARTAQLSNKLDTGTIDIGYHYDQNAPYVVVVRPSDSNALSGTQSIDFNFESGFGTTSLLRTVLNYSATQSGGTRIVDANLNSSSYSCSAGPVFVCSYSWNTRTIPDGNYFIVLTGTDTNGSATDSSDNNFSVANVSISGCTSASGCETRTCGNNLCDGTESAVTCPVDCAAVCGDRACTHTENRDVCPVDCAVGCGNRVCEAGEDVQSCAVDCAPVTVLGEERLLAMQVSPLTAAGLESFLNSAGIIDLVGVNDALSRVSVKRFFVRQTVSDGVSEFVQTKVVLEITNLTEFPLKNIKLAERVPYLVLSDVSGVSSVFPFDSFSDSGAVVFTVPGLFANQTIELDYVLASGLSEAQAELFDLPFAFSVTDATVSEVEQTTCTVDSDCAQTDQCALNRCIRGSCFAVKFPEGEVCDIGAVCRSGVCTPAVTPYQFPFGVNWAEVLTIGLFLVVLGIIAREYFRKE